MKIIICGLVTRKSDVVCEIVTLRGAFSTAEHLLLLHSMQQVQLIAIEHSAYFMKQIPVQTASKCEKYSLPSEMEGANYALFKIVLLEGHVINVRTLQDGPYNHAANSDILAVTGLRHIQAQ
jgi:hypothetical protein